MPTHNIEDTAKLMNFTPNYVRALIRKGALKSALEPIVPESLVKRHMVSDEAITEYLTGTVSRARRKDGRNKFVVYMSHEESPKVQALLRANGFAGIADTLRTWNPLKPPALRSTTRRKKKDGPTV